MKAFYLYELGIKPWEQTSAISNSRFATITIVDRSVSDLFSICLIIISSINQILPRTLKWLTVGYPIGGSKIQELKLVKQLKSDLSDYDFLNKNSDSNIYSYIKHMVSPVSESDLNTITQSRYSALLFLPDAELESQEVWEELKNSDGGLDLEGIERLISKHNEFVICRLYESDTHTALQFIGSVEQLGLLCLKKLSELEIEKIEERDVSKLINS